MQTTDELFARTNWHEFADAVGEVDGNFDRTPAELRVIFEGLPETIRDIAHCWSLGDTVFRDAAFVHLRDQKRAGS